MVLEELVTTTVQVDPGGDYVQIPVVVDIHERRTATRFSYRGRLDPAECGAGDVLEQSIARCFASSEEIDKPIAVVVAKNAGHIIVRELDTKVFTHILEVARVIPIQATGSRSIGQQDVRVSVPVEIAERQPATVSFIVQPDSR